MIIVSNTSPISNLNIIGEISLLQQIYPKVLIPPAVHSDLTRLPVLQPTMVALLGVGWLEIQPPTNLQLLDILKKLQGSKKSCNLRRLGKSLMGTADLIGLSTVWIRRRTRN
jgi:predicted nucleic acid-binding protein